MILTKEIEIKTTNKNIGHYNKYFPSIKSGDDIIITPDQLPLTSKTKVDVECDNCKDRFNIIYFSYLRNIKSGDYYCKKCSHIKSEVTSLLRYGFKHPLQSNEIKEKVKKTNIDRYGYNYPNQNDEVKEKIKNTCLDKYNETSFMKTQQFKDLSKDKRETKYLRNLFFELNPKLENLKYPKIR